MKMKPLLTLTMTGALLALAASAQDAPIRIQPVPGIEVEPAQPPPDFAPGEGFPEQPDMPPEGWGEPGFPGEIIMPGRFQIISAQIQQNGKSLPIVLKLDTQTGEVWELKLTESKFFVNGKVQVRTQMNFEPLGQNREPRRGQGRGFMPGRPDFDRDQPDDDVEEAVPDRPRFRPRPAPGRPEPGRRNLIEPETEPTPRPRR